ncbi:MAG: STAS domain-containing protein [Phycisphaerae bacterium]|nr:STAS domain-containing protein [Phycisphaerae bacterium]MDW8262003.1 STAS domain-containing protein [Phycisphaerales bacterium]
MADPIPGVSVAPTADGFVIRVTGRGTVRESRVVKDLAARTLREDPKSVVVLELSGCGYVDSTFLGTMMDLHRTAGDPRRFAIAAPPAQRSRLLGLARLDRLLTGMDEPPAVMGDFVAVPTPEATSREILSHVMECHQRLSEIDCPMSPIFGRIAEQMRRELEQQSTG